MNLDLLKNKISDSGLKKKYIASKLNITFQAFNNKMLNKTAFSIKDIKVLKNILNLTDDDMTEIFF